LAEKSELFVFCDGPSDESQRDYVRQVREYIRTIDGFRNVTVVEQSENLGLAASIIGGVKRVVNEYGKVIVLEDDLVTSPFFLTYMNEALGLYFEDSRVMSVTGYMFPVRFKLPDTFFIYGGTCSWGWGTWKRAWARFNPDARELLERITKSYDSISHFNYGGTYDYLRMLRDNAAGKNDSWAIRWYASVFLEGGYGLWPRSSLVNNIGHDSSGRHCGTNDAFRVSQLADRIAVRRIPVEECEEARRCICEFFGCIHGLNGGVKHRIHRKMGLFLAQARTKLSGHHCL
jgi:hypothetical protein